MKIEYILITNNCKGFLNNIDSLVSFINAEENINIASDKGTITLQENGNIHLSNIYTEKFNSARRNENNYKITFEINDEKNAESLEKISKRFIKCIENINKEKYVLHTAVDDLNLYYSRKAYPLINEIENLYRKTIIYFLVEKVGINWASLTLSPEFKEDIKRRNGKNKFNHHENILYELNFIQLADFLFESFTQESPRMIFGKIKDIVDTHSEESFKEISELLPQSNWERYFMQDLSMVKQEDIKEKWSELYDLRNKVAHNKCFKSDDHKKLVELYADLKGINQKIWDNMDNIKIKNNDKQNIENSLSTIIDNSIEFTSKYTDSLASVNNAIAITKAYQNIYDGFCKSIVTEELLEKMDIISRMGKSTVTEELIEQVKKRIEWANL